MKRFNRIAAFTMIPIAFLVTAMSALAATSQPAYVQASVPSTGAPDYSNPARWLSLPTTGTAPVDVFYLYPTSYVATGSEPIICAVDNPQMIAGAKVAFARQATAFQPLANVFAPFYRQADAADRAAMPQAQQDQVVAGAPTQDGIAAFDYYIKHYNKGRPFILVGHSLGSNVLANLLPLYMSKNPDVYKRMVAAYIVGYSITPTYLAKYPYLKFAQGANDTGVIVSWNTEGPILVGKNPVTLPGGIAINPISWTRTETTATAEQSLGSELLDPATGGSPILDPDGSVHRFGNLADARVDLTRGVVVCSSIPETIAAEFTGSFPEGVYHPFDYPFYYFNVKQNAIDRVAHFVAPTSLARPAVSPSRPRHGKTATFTSFLTPSAAASAGALKMYFYRWDTKTVRKKVGRRYKTVRVKYWHLRATKSARATSAGSISLQYKLLRSGSWKVVVAYSGSKAYSRSTSFNKYFTLR